MKFVLASHNKGKLTEFNVDIVSDNNTRKPYM